MLSRGQWGLYLAGMATEAAFILALAAIAFGLAYLAVTVFR
jgi:hypothetical protein